MSGKQMPPTKEDYAEFEKNYTGIMEPDRAYMAMVTGDNRYRLRRDLFPGRSVNDLPSKKDLKEED